MSHFPDHLRQVLDGMAAEIRATDAAMLEPEVVADHRRVRALTARRRAVGPVAERWQAFRALERERAALDALVHGSDAEMAALARDDLASIPGRLDALAEEIQRLLVTGEDDRVGSVILEVRAGVGGQEAAIWAGDLLEMYRRMAVRRGWTWEEMDLRPGDAGGFTQAVVEVSGDGAWSVLGYEGGTHQVKRVPATEAQGRIHTSTATVAVLPEPEEVEEAVPADEVKEMLTTAQGPGGQNVNKVATAVHLIHLPTGIEVRMQETRSQLQNREKAWRLLRARVLEARRQAAEAARSAERRLMMGSGGRAEKIRTYRWKEGIAVDHRLERSFPLQTVMQGEGDELADALRRADVAERLAAM
ncbi:MAG: peptide chain release factor 1 [Planctomycetota bacterium]|jgi:peptide chain release factor 1